MKKTIACFFGGKSSEYEVSLKSASQIIEAIDKDKYKLIFIGITKEGKIYKYDGEIGNICNDTWHLSKCNPVVISPNQDKGLYVFSENKYDFIGIDLAFIMIHGKNGEDGRLQGLLELSGIPYTGCDMLSSAICMDKYLAHELVKSKNILVPKAFLVPKDYDFDSIKTKTLMLGFPVYVKPVNGGSSIGISKVYNSDELLLAIKKAFKYDSKVIIEENIVANEVGCAVIGNNNLIIGEVDEMILQIDFLDYGEKYNNSNIEILLPANLSDEVRQKIRKTALHIYKTLGCSGFARVDMFYTKDGQLYFNEVNTIPGFTTKSRFPNMLKAIGYSYAEIVEKIIELGLERKANE